MEGRVPGRVLAEKISLTQMRVDPGHRHDSVVLMSRGPGPRLWHCPAACGSISAPGKPASARPSVHPRPKKVCQRPLTVAPVLGRGSGKSDRVFNNTLTPGGETGGSEWVIWLSCTLDLGAWGHHTGGQGPGRGVEGPSEPHKGLVLRSGMQS